MGRIVQFRQERTAQRIGGADGRLEPNGEIVLFTGVRYERHGEIDRQGDDRHHCARHSEALALAQRDWLDLPE